MGVPVTLTEWLVVHYREVLLLFAVLIFLAMLRYVWPHDQP